MLDFDIKHYIQADSGFRFSPDTWYRYPVPIPGTDTWYRYLVPIPGSDYLVCTQASYMSPLYRLSHNSGISKEYLTVKPLYFPTYTKQVGIFFCLPSLRILLAKFCFFFFGLMLLSFLLHIILSLPYCCDHPAR